MTEIRITLTLREGKSRELLLTLQSLNRQAAGYVKTIIRSPPDDEHHLTIIQQWQTWQDVEQYMQLYAYDVLRCALRVLTTSARIELKQTAPVFETCAVRANS